MTEVINKSVTKGDHEFTTYAQPGAFNFWIPQSIYYNGSKAAATARLLPELLPYWSLERDFQLSRTTKLEGWWGNGVALSVTKMASLSWEVEGDIIAKVKRAQDLLHTTDGGKGWVTFITKHLRDYLLTDNGAFIEIVRASKGAGAQIIGLVHLDSRRCTRTGDPETPVLYRDRLGEVHEIKDYQIIYLADQSDPSDTYNGVGECAASRAYDEIRLAAAIRRYNLEKISGNKPLAISFVNGINKTSLENALAVDESTRAARGAVLYGSHLIVPIITNERIETAKIEIASLPDNFDYKTFADEIRLAYANALGVGLQTLQPLSGQGLGTGTQSEVLYDKERGQGLASWRQDFAHASNEKVFPNSITYAWHERDTRDELQQAQLDNQRAATAATLVGTQGAVLDSAKAIQWLVDKNVLPKEFLPATGDLTPDVSLDDLEKSEELENLPEEQPGQAAPGQPAAPPPPGGTVGEAVNRLQSALPNTTKALKALAARMRRRND